MHSDGWPRAIRRAHGRRSDGHRYLIWGQALDASEFVAMTPNGLHSIAYTGPITAESIYFDYQVLGQNLFAGQPDWTVTGGVASSNTDLPY